MSLRRFLLFILGPLLAADAAAIDMKVDRVLVNLPVSGAPVTWSSVTFQQTFGSVPLVFATATTSNPDPAGIRVRNITTSGFEIGVVEPQNEDGQTAAMSVDYFAAEAGTYTFPGGVRMVVGSTTTTTQQGNGVPGTGWDDLNFPVTFPNTPAVIAQIQTINSQPGLEAGVLSSPSLEVAIRNVTPADMDIALERSDSNNGALVAETIGYLALASGEEVQIAGVDIKALRTPDNIVGWDETCINNAFPSAFSATPLVIATKNSRDGGDGGWLRICAKSPSGVESTIDEDRVGDPERSHTNEVAGIIAITQAFNGSRNGRDMEAGSVNILSTSSPKTWTNVSFANAFSATPRIFALPTDQGLPPAALRVRNITTAGFEIAAVVPTGSPPSHPQMEVDYIAIIEGEHTLSNGDVFEVGSVDTTLYQAGNGGSTGVVNVNFNRSNSAGSAMLLQIQSNNNEPTLDPNTVSSPWLVTATTALGPASASIALERAEASSGSISVAETIAYFVVSDGANESLEATDGGDVDYEMFVSADNIQGTVEGCYYNNYTDTYASPYAVASQSSRDGNNGGWPRRCGLESTRIGLGIDEDQANDTERVHTTERASIFVFSRAFEAEFNAIDHYAIFHSGSGVNCEAEPVTIAAHDAVDLGTEASGRLITVSATSTSPGWSAADASWSLLSGAGNFVVVGPGVARYTFATGESSVQLALSNTSVADIDIDVVDAEPGLGDRDGVAEDPILPFVSSGFRFYNDANGDGDADASDSIASPLVAGVASGQLILRGVTSDGTTGACLPRVSGSQTVDIGYECLNPSTCIRSDDAQINSSPIGDNDSGSVTNYNNVPLIFDADGEAPFSLQYFDAGVIRLHARLALPASAADPAITLVGVSDTTTVRPADLFVTAITTSSGAPNPGTTVAGGGFTAANSPFTVRVQARNAQGNSTPNFGNETASEGIVLSAESLIMPSTGNLPTLLSATSFTPGPTAGEFENTAVRWPEVGTITLRAQIRDGDYLGTGDVLGSISSNVGRFFPDHLRLTSASVTNGCSSGFTYMSDSAFNYLPMDINYSIEAVTAGLTRLQNYDDTYPTANFIFDAEDANDGTNRNARLSAPFGSWVDGRYELTGSDNAGFARASDLNGEVPDGPFSAVQIALRARGDDPDNANFLAAARNINASTSGDCSTAGNCNAISLGSAVDLRFGRLYIGNAHGPESASLDVPFEIQQWDAINGFTRNTSDSCTQISLASIRFDGNALNVDTNRTVTVGGGTSTGAFDAFSPGVSLSFIGGDAGLNFSPPGAGNSGEFNVDVDLSSTPWLRSDWNNDGNAADDTALPRAVIQFGRYRGHDRIIFWREVLN